MKLLFAECCGDIVAPPKTNYVIRFCQCKQSAVWWEDGMMGMLAVFSFLDPDAKLNTAVSVLGLHNGFLTMPFTKEGGIEYGCIQGNAIEKILTNTPSNYVFKGVNSVIIKVRPGFTYDIKLINLAEFERVKALHPQLY